MEKKWYKSKTVWFNVGVGLVAAGTELTPLLDLIAGPELDAMRAYLVISLSMGNTILRVVTRTKVTL